MARASMEKKKKQQQTKTKPNKLKNHTPFNDLG